MKQAALLALCALVVLALWAMFGCGSSTANKACTTCTFLYSGNSGSPGSMAGFFSFSGSLTILGTPFSTGGAATLGLAVVNNSFLYGAVPASSGGGGILMMPITAGTGTSNGVTASPGTAGSLGAPKMFAGGHNFNGLAAAPNGKFLYAADVTSNQVFAYSIDSAGSLTAIGPAGGISVGPDPFNLRTDAAGKFLFVASCDCTSPHSPSQGAVWVFSINNDGTLAAPGASFPLGGAAHPADVVPSPDGTLLYVANAASLSGANADQILTESIDSNSGALSQSAPPKALTPVAAGGSSLCTQVPSTHCGSVVITPDAHFVFTADSGIGEVSGFSVGAAITAFSITSNVVTLFATNSFSAGDTVTISGLSTATYLNGQTFTVLSSGLSSSQFQISFAHADVNKTTDAGFATPPNGALTFLANTSTGGSPATALVSPAGGFFYVTDFDHGTVLAFTIGASGSLTSSGTLNTGGTNPFGLAMTH